MQGPLSGRQPLHPVLLLLAVAVLACDRQKQPPEHGMLLGEPLPPAPLVLRDSRGNAFDLAAQKGKGVLIYFGYTHCPDVCPTTLADFGRAFKLLGGASRDLRLVFVSVDPDRDTPVIAESYARQFDSSFAGFAPTKAEVDTIKGAWGFAVEKETMPGMKMAMKMDGYGVTHPAGVFFVSRDGKVTFVFSPGVKPDEIASDLKRLR